MVELPDVVVEALARHVAVFPPATVMELEDRNASRKGHKRSAELLFTTSNGLPLQRSTWSNVWGTARKKAGLPDEFTMHELRHFLATALIHRGASVKTVQLALGHSNPMITLNRYTHEWPDALDRTRALLDAALTVPMINTGTQSGSAV